METAGEAPPRYQRLSKLGEGSYGIVYKAKDTFTGEIVAMKCMKLRQEVDGIKPTTLREISVLRSVSHPNLLCLKDVIATETSLTIITDYLDFDLREMFLRTHSAPLKEPLARSYAFQMLCGIFSLHTCRIVHRDLKPENILLDCEGNLKIGDFGLSRYFTLPMRPYTPEVVSLWYRPPELFFGKRYYDLSIDMWSIGCMIAEMYTGVPLFHGDSEVDQLHKIFSILGTPTPEDLPNYNDLVEDMKGMIRDFPRKSWSEVLRTDNLELIDLMNKIMQYNPAKRITPQDALRHPYFATIAHLIRQKCYPEELL